MAKVGPKPGSKMRLRKLKSVQERFESKFTKEENGCWIWRASIGTTGYGKFGNGRRSNLITHAAHRFSYSFYKGEIPDGFHVLHSCDNRKCVNPDHLSIGTRQDNMDDMKKKCRQSHGENHPFCKITDLQVNYIKDIMKRNPKTSKKKIAEMFGISEKHIWAITHGICRDHGLRPIYARKDEVIL